MYRLKNETKIVTILISRQFITKSKNLYDILGITPHATQADIKSAYYKLSKAYHPDRNTDPVSGDKFRAITEAYEVLGNYRLRKLYDKGIIHTAGKEYTHHSRPHQKTQPYDAEHEVDDATTKFYKSRLRQEHTSKSKVYDFDEWTKEHYGDTFKKQQELKKRQHFKSHRDIRHADKSGSRYTLFGLIGFLTCVIIIAEYLSTARLDIVDPSKFDDSSSKKD